MKSRNPFVIYGYSSPEYFCDRDNETAALVSALENGRNVTLFALRKIGKTGLIHNVFHKMSKLDKSAGFIYADISPAENLESFVKLLSEAIISQLESKHESMLREAVKMLKNIRPKLSFSPEGEPSFSLFFDSPEETRNTLKSILEYLNKRSERQYIYFAIDEFQQILNFPEKNVEALLRSEIQFMKNVRFIFSGSSQNLMASIFSNAGRPFYQSTQMMHLQKIEPDLYKKFIKSKFQSNSLEITGEALERIIEVTYSHTFYVQYLCNRLFEAAESKADEGLVNDVLNNILNENESIYYGYRSILRKHHWSLVRAIAKENGAANLTSKDFISKYELGSHSTVASAKDSLLAKDIIYQSEGKYYVYDVFFSRWLERL